MKITKSNMPKYTQTIHEDCGGAIILVSQGGESRADSARLACDKCNHVWPNVVLRLWPDQKPYSAKQIA